MGDDRHHRRRRDQDGQLTKLRDNERTAGARGAMAGEAKRQQRRRQADRDDDNANGLDNRDGAQIGIEFGADRHHLRHRAGRGRQIGRNVVPAVHHAQIGPAGDADASYRHQQNGDAERISRHALQRLRRHHRTQ